MATTLTHDEMKAVVRHHFEEFVDRKKAEVIYQNMTSTFYDHDGPGGQPADRDKDEQMMRHLYDVMPGIHVVIEAMVAEADMVVCRNRWLWNDPTTGGPMEFSGFVQWRFEGHQIAERWATVTAPRAVSGEGASGGESGA